MPVAFALGRADAVWEREYAEYALHAARTPARLNPADYFLYMPLLPEDDRGELRYDRLVLAAGSVNKLLPIPGVAEKARGFRGIPEAHYLRDHVIRRMELADSADDPAERAAHGAVLTEALHRRRSRSRDDDPPRWMLLDVAHRVLPVLPQLDERISRTADRVLRRRGVDVRMGTSVETATPDGVRLTDGRDVPTRSLIWCVGVRPDPLVAAVGLDTAKGRLVVDEYLNVPGHPEIFACGDAAAVPDPNRPGEVTAMTAQQAVRQGRRAARNVAATYGTGTARPYRHHELGFAVDLGGAQAAANPLRVPLSGPAAKVATRGYHLPSLPGNRIRTTADWTLDAVLPRQIVQVGLVRSPLVPLETAAPEVPLIPHRIAGRATNSAAADWFCRAPAWIM